MPYLTFETYSGLDQLREATDDADKMLKITLEAQGSQGQPKKAVDSSGAQRSQGQPKKAGGSSVAQERSRDKEQSKDKMLVLAYLREKCVHVSRALHQFYYYSLNTHARDTKQVITTYVKNRRSKATGQLPKPDGSSPEIFMVDQLWLWVLDESMFSELPSRARHLTITLRDDHH
jgi:hypothetical protein